MLPPAAADSQVMTAAPRRSAWSASIGSGIQWGDFIVDQATLSSWDFDAGFPLRGTLERTVASRVSVGVAFSYARLPLTYTGLSVSPICGGQCAADATISSYGALVRMGGGPGFHQVLEVFVGALRYGNFEQAAPRATLPPRSNTDFAFGAGYGLGYGFANEWEFQLIQDALNSVHERSTLPGAGGRIARHYTTRLGLRVGF
jgi:hypothetical protein